MDLVIKRRGFTLIEVLLALLFVAVIATISLIALNTMNRTSELLHTEREMLGELSLFFARMEHDMGNVVEREWRLGNEIMPPMSGGGGEITFVRFGEMKIDVGGLQRVGYSSAPGGAMYKVWPLLDSPNDQEPEVFTAIEGIVALSFSFKYTGIWLDSWNEPYLPMAVKATIVTTKGTTVWRVFDIQ